MKKILSAIGLILLIISSATRQSLAQAPNWQWAKAAGGTSTEGGKGISTDDSGNVFITSYFMSSSITFGATTLTNAGSGDVYVVKYSPSGNVLWAKAAGGTSFDSGESISTDAIGNVFVTGFFQSTSLTFGSITLTKLGDRDIFVVKYDNNGNVLWAKSAGGTKDDYGNGISTDVSGNAFITGGFYGSSITFGTTTLTNSLSSGNSEDIFVVKYDANGNVLWAKSGGGTWDDYGKSISTDASGNVFITGSFQSSSVVFETITIPNAGSWDIFVMKFDSGGNVLWAKAAGGTVDEGAQCISTDESGNAVVTGQFRSSSVIFGSTTFTSAGNSDIFVVKYDADGNVLWAKSAGGTDYEWGFGISTDAIGNVFVTGSFWSSSLTFESTILTNANTNSSDDIFVVKYDGSGNLLWAKSAGASSYDYGEGISTDVSGNVFITGSFVSSSLTLGSSILGNAGGNDIFVAKLNGSTGIEEVFSSANINIYPNPCTGKFTISTEELLQSISIYNVLGEIVYHSLIINTQFEINFSKNPKGIYSIVVKEHDKFFYKKLIIQ